MGTLGSASIQLTLDRSRFDSDLKKLQSADAGSIVIRAKLDTKEFDKQLLGLSKLVSPVFIPLELDTAKFNEQIKKLSANIDPIKIDLAPNVKDFQEKLKRIGRISPIEVEIKVDKTAVRSQFTEIGRYAAAGFAEGFSGAEGAGKSAVDSMVRSVKSQLGIQSPSRVFREIGKYAIAGLMQGLETVDESKLKGVTNKIEDYFKKSKIKINLDIDASGISGKVKVQASSPVEKATQNAGDFGKNITKSIEDGFQKAKPKANFLGAIFGGLGSLITIPLAATLRGAFEGIGTPLGLQLGTGVTKAFQSTLGANIGSLELISQKAVEKSLQAIPKAQEAIVEVIKSNPIGSAIAKQLELLQRTLELYSINLSPQKAVKSLATDRERAVASSSAAFTGVEAQFKATKKAKASAASEFLDIANNQEGIKKIVPLIKQKEEDLAKKQKKLQAAQQAIAALEIRLQKIAELPVEQRGAVETSIKSKMAEFSEVLAGGNLSIEQDVKAIASLKKTGADYFERLNSQIKLLADLGVEQELSSQSAELLKSMEIFEQMAAAQKSVQTAQSSVKTNAKTSTAIRGKKLTKLTDLATSAKTNLDSVIVSPDATAEQVQKLQKRATAANKALDLYKLELADPAKEIEKLNRKLAAANEVLAENIQELQTRLTKAIPALYSNASHEVVKVGNLNEIAPQKPKSVVQEQKEYYSEGAILQREQGKKKEQEIKRNIANNRSETELPREYREIVKDVADLYAGIKVKSRDIPQLKASGTQQELGYSGLYDPTKNQVSVSNELFSRAQSGTLTPLDISTLTHEIIHAIDYGFGKKTQIDAADSVRNIQPTAEELRIEGGRIEGSTRFEDAEKNHGQSRDLSRTLETNAYIGDLRLSPEVVKRTEKRRAIHNFETEFGRGAPLAVSQYKDINSSLDSHYTKVQEQALSSDVNIDKEGKDSLARQKLILEKGFSELKPLLDKARSSLHVLPTEEIIALQESLRNTLASLMSAIENEQAALQSELGKKKLALVEKIPPIEPSHDVSNSLKNEPSSTESEFKNSSDVRKFAASNLNAKGVKDLARRMGIDTKHANKELLLNEISSSGGSADGRERIAQLIGQLKPDSFLSKSNAKGSASPSTDAPKIIGELKKARKELADALKIAQELDIKDRRVAFESIIQSAAQQEAIAKQLSSEHQLTPAHSKSLGGVKTQLKSISYQAKLSLPHVTQDDIVPINLSSPQFAKQQKSQPQEIFDIGLSKVGKNKASEKIKNGQEELKRATENFQKIFTQVVKASGIDPATTEGRVPTVSFLSAIAKGGGQYQGKGNRIALSMDARKKLALGKLSLDDLDTIAHEIRHAIQLDFGRAKESDIEAGKTGIPLLSTKRKSDRRRAEASTRAYRSQFKENYGANPSNEAINSVFALEQDAVAFAAQVAPILHKNLKNILKPQKDSKPIPLTSNLVMPKVFELPVSSKNSLSKLPLPPAPWEVDPSLDFRNQKPKPRTTLFSIPNTTPPPPPGFNSPIGRSALPTPPPPPGFNSPIGKPSSLPIPPPPPDFNLPIKVKQLVEKVKDSDELFKIVTDIQKDQTKNLNQKLKEYDRIIKIYDDLEAEKVKQNQALDDKFDPEKIDQQRQTIRQRAKLSANLERRHGLDGLAPEILPERINSLGETGKSPSILQGIKDIFKSLDNSVAKRVKKRAAQLAIEVDTAIAPSLETQAIAAEQRGDKVEQKQYQKLARQSRAATSGIAKILETPGDLTEKQVKQLDRLTSQLEKVYDAIGRPLPSQGFLESIGIGASGAIGLVKNLGGVVKGFLAFSIGMWAQNFFGSIAQESFKAFVELDRLKTALNFASGGSAGGAQNLAFVRKTVEDLKVPLKASTEGFVQLAAAARGTSLEGKGTRELFLGMADASTVLSLSNEQTSRAFLALQQALSKGKLSSEEMRQQLAESGLTGALGIAARAMGVTEAEFGRLLDTGSILSEDFLPKFSKQLQAEFGDAAKDASGNAQSAIFGVENAFLSLQQGVGEGIAPAATAGLNVFAVVLKGIASVAKELGFILLSVSLVLSGKMLSALGAVLSEMIKVNFAQVGLTGGMKAFGQTINNSASVKWAAGIFAVLEVVKLLNDAVNTDLVKSFNEAAKAAKKTAEEAANAYKKASKPESSNDFGKLADDFLISPIRNNAQKLQSNPVNSALSAVAASYVPGGAIALKGASKLQTFGELERDTTIKDINDLSDETKNFLAAAGVRLQGLKNRTGKTGQLPKVDAELFDAEQQRQITQAQIKRDFTDKGLAVPAKSRQKLEEQNEQIKKLNDKRAEIAKPITLDSTKTDQYINSTKALLQVLDDPKAVTALGGVEAVEKLKVKLKEIAAPLKEFKAQQEETFGSLRVDPIRAFTQALRGLNLALAEGQEKNKENLAKNKLANARVAIAGFSTNKLATRQLALSNANKEYEAAQVDEANSATAVKTYDEAANKPDFQATLKRLGVSPDSSTAKIDDILKNTQDEADKGILEQLKAGRESKTKFTETQSATLDAKTKRDQVVQDNSLFSIDDNAASSRAATQKAENQKITAVRNAQAARLITEEVASEKISRIGLASTRSQQKNLNQQLAALRTYHDQGAISAERFAEKERELTTEQTNLEKQEAENRLAVQQAVLARRLKDIEFANKKAESAIALSQTTSTTGVKARLLTSGITTSAKDNADLEQNSIDQKTATERTGLIKTKIAQNQQEYKEGLRSAREFAEQQMALNLELAQSYSSLTDLKIAAEEKYRAIVERSISTNKTIASTVIDKRLLAAGLTPQAQDQAAIDKNKLDQQEVADKIKFIKSRVKNESAAKDEIAALDSQLTKLKIEEEQKRRESVEQNIQRILQTEENRFKKQTSQLDESKAKLDLYNQSLERTNKLEQSRQSLSKAVSDATQGRAENQRTDTDDAQGLVDKLKDPNVKRRTKAAAREQLRDMGYEVNSNTRPEEIELQIKEKRIEAENRIALIKQAALEKEQEFGRKALENDLKRQKIAAQTLLYEAQSAQLSAQKAKNEAEGALKIAIAKKDPLAIETAQTNLNIADKQVDLSNDRVSSAQANLNDQGEIAANSTAEQKATQGAQTESFEYGEKRRQRQGALDLVETGEKARRPISLSSAEAKTQTSPEFTLPQRIDINQMPKLDLKPGENIFDAYQRQRNEVQQTQGVALPNNKFDMPPIDKTTQAISSTNIQPRESGSGNQFVEALKMANQGIEQRLDALSSAIITLANTPRSLTVSSPQPVDDAARLMNNFSRGQVMAQGL